MKGVTECEMCAETARTRYRVWVTPDPDLPPEKYGNALTVCTDCRDVLIPRDD